jgi:transcriptional regulator GlxA family with amidase domain
MKYLLFLLPALICLSLYSQADERKLNVAILIYEGVYLLDFTGPAEVFSDAYLENETQAFNVYTIAVDTNLIHTQTGLKIIPDYSILDFPKPDILVIPGGNPRLLKSDSALKNWIINNSKESKYTISICTGAFILAEAGLLDSMEATTWHGAVERLKSIYPKVKVVSGVRWTDNGKILTTSGVSAGIDGSLYLVSKILGKGIADKTAKYMDYDYWK